MHDTSTQYCIAFTSPMSGSQTSSVVMSSNPTMSWYMQKKSQETGKQVLWEAPHGADCRHIASEHGHKFTGGLKSMFVALDTCFYLFLAAFAAASLAFFAAILASLASSSALSLASSSAYTHTQQTHMSHLSRKVASKCPWSSGSWLYIVGQVPISLHPVDCRT